MNGKEFLAGVRERFLKAMEDAISRGEEGGGAKNHANIAKRLQETPSTMSLIVNNPDRTPTVRQIAWFCGEFGYSEKYIMRGLGGMRDEQPGQDIIGFKELDIEELNVELKYQKDKLEACQRRNTMLEQQLKAQSKS